MAESVSIIQTIISLRYIITVEPVFLSYLASLALQKILLQQFLYDYVSNSYNFTKALSNELCDPNNTASARNISLTTLGLTETNSDLTNLENKIQARTSYILLLLSITNTIPSVLVSVMYGAWSDRVGRRPLLILSLAGIVIQNLSVICVANYALPYYLLFIGSAISGVSGSFSCILLCGFAYISDITDSKNPLPYYLLFIGSAISGVSGSFSCILLCGFAYISDITDSKNRAFRIGILEAMIYVGATVSFFVSGVWVQNSGGYKQPFWGAFAMALFALLYVIIVLPESKRSNDTQQATRLNPFKCSSIRNMANMLRQKPILGVGLLAFLLIVFGAFNDIIIIYLKAHPICWNALLVGVWYGLQTATKAIGLVVGTKIFQRFCSDSVMVLIGIISWILNSITVAVTTSTLVLFLSLVPGVFQAMSTAGTRTVLSKLTPRDKQGMIFSAVGMIEALASFLAPLAYNTVYPASRSVLHFPPFCFYMTAGILALAVPLVLLVYFKGVLPMKYQSFVDSDVPCVVEDKDKDNNKEQCIGKEEVHIKAVND